MSERFDINNVDDFERIDNRIRDDKIYPGPEGYYSLLYRGQSKDSYTLRPSVARYVNSEYELKLLEEGIVSDINNLIKEKEWFRNIIQFTTHENPYSFENEWRLLAQIQHLGLPTRLLDWTIKSKIALFFAVENNHSDAGQFWVYKMPNEQNYNVNLDVSPYVTEKHCVYNSPFISSEETDVKVGEERKASQVGQFTFLNRGNSLESMEKLAQLEKRIVKYTINPNSKQEILDFLSRENITRDIVYAHKVDFHYKKLEDELNKIKEKYKLL